MPEETPAPEATEYTIDELATVTRLPSRTIRFYQSKGALPGPKIRGRVAYYGGEHIDRLKLIGELQDRGLRIKAIRDILGKVDKGELVLNEWLGLEHKLQEPWANDRPRVMTQAELTELIGERPPGFLAELLRLRELERSGDSYLVRSPALLQVALKLEAGGVDLETAVGAGAMLKKHLSKMATELVEYFFKRAGEGFGSDTTAADLGKAYEALRPMGMEAVRVVFAREMERSLRKLLDSGATTEMSSRAANKKRRPR